MRVIVADKLSKAGVDALAERFDVDVRTGLDKAELLEVIPAYDAIVVRSATIVDADVIAAASKLKVIARAGIGLDNVDVDAATAKGIIVCNAPQSNVISAAEHTVALLLALARQIPGADTSLRAGQWQRSAFEGVELHGKTLGIVGLGRVGVLVAQRCSAFGMQVTAYDPFVSTDRAARMGVELIGSVDALCRQADVVCVHLPKTAETVGIIGEAQLREMKPSAFVVNTARGGIVDEDALHTALTEGWIAGAALDVFSDEPMTASPLFALDNVVVTPHLGASTTEAQDKAGTMVAEFVTAALAGEFVPSAVNVQVTQAVPEAVKPFMPLVEQLGCVLTALHTGQAGELVVEYHGKIAAEDTQALTLSALKGVLAGVVSEPVSFVNAPLLAEERGLKVATVSSESFEDFVSLVRLRLGDARIAGTLIGPRHKARLVEVWGFAVDMEPSDHMVFFRYTDRPGIVGTIGNRLGDADVNIATMQVGRAEQGGDAVIAMSVDSPIPSGVLEEIRHRIGAAEARAIDLS